MKNDPRAKSGVGIALCTIRRAKCMTVDAFERILFALNNIVSQEGPEILCKQQSLSSWTRFARFRADLRLFRFNPCFSRSR
jgi:hypothetical protein